MRRWAEKPLRRSRIEIIPMIDVMMFLLVFFVLISINVIPAMGIKTALPKSAQAEQQQHRRNVVVTLGNQGELQLDGRELAMSQLGEALRALRKPDEQIFVVINGDQGVALQRVVDVMDAVKSAGFDALSIAAKKS
jgi:biopolymer transport protein ExbD